MYSTIADLPADVRGVLPEEAQRLYLAIVNPALTQYAGDEAKASAVAWTGLANAGWRKGPDGSWVIAKRWESCSPVSKRDDGGRVFGWATQIVDERGVIVVDHQQHTIDPATLEAAAYAYVQRGTGGVLHERTKGPAGGLEGEPVQVSKLIESCVVTPAKRVALGLDGTGPTGWWLGFEIEDAGVREAVAKGLLGELSIHGTALRRGEALTSLEIDEVSLVDAGAAKGARLVADPAHRTVIWKRSPSAIAKEKTTMDPTTPAKTPLDTILASLKHEDAKVILDAIQAAAQPHQEPDGDEPAPEMEAMSKRLAASEAAQKAAETQARELVSKLRDLEERAAQRDALEVVAKRGLDRVPGLQPADAAALVRGTLDRAASDRVLAALETVSKSLASGGDSPLRVLGAAGGDESAIGQLEKIAVSKRAADPKLTAAQAFTLAAKERPDLYVQTRG